jgi:hypothetical protein
MILWVPVNRVMFCGEDAALPPAEIGRYASAGARAFLTAYRRPDPGPASITGPDPVVKQAGGQAPLADQPGAD